MAKPFTAQAFQEIANVSRETCARLQIYADILSAWQARINLVSDASLADVWRRHLLDSAQLIGHIPPSARTLIDFGSGAGFPGLVLAMLSGLEVTLVESNTRKAAFLREVARATQTAVDVRAVRVETLPPTHFDIITARALASVDALCELAAPFFAAREDLPTAALFLKGERAAEELTLAEKRWNIRAESLTSITDPAGSILRISALGHR